MTTTAATINTATNTLPIPGILNLEYWWSAPWDITLNSDDTSLKLLTQFQITSVVGHEEEPNNFYSTFEGTISATVLGCNLISIPIYGIYTTYVVTFHVTTPEGVTYTFTGLYIRDATGARIINGRIYKGDPTDDGSWSATAQGLATGPPTSDPSGNSLLEGKNAQVPAPSPAPV